MIFSDGIPTSTIKTPTEPAADDPKNHKPHTNTAAAFLQPEEGSFISLNLLSAEKIIPLGERKEATLGRVSQGQPVIPDIDLTPFKAYEAGVSRMHASIKIKENLITIIDLASVNGTRINGKKISAHIPYPIKGGDILTLGRFKIQILLSNKQNGG
ncbi:FHA domain-containing protein [Chloroflexota bacterium]